MTKAQKVENPITYVFGQHLNREVLCAIHGTTGQFHHQYVDPNSQLDTKKGKKQGQRVKTYDPREECLKGLYSDGKGPYMPNEWFEKAISDAGVNFIFKGRKTYRDHLKSGIMVRPDRIRMPIQEWIIDSRWVHVPPGPKNPVVMRHRAFFPKWEGEFTIIIKNPAIDLNVLAEIVEYAGRYLGVGDHRPKFGTFEITKFELIS